MLITFSIKPADNSFDMMLEAGEYRQLWQNNRRAIVQAFRKLTGLEFQQHYITARVIKGRYAQAGSPSKAMTLPGDYMPLDYKACTMMHELSHRLLGGNALGPVSLGLILETGRPHPRFANYEHRHIYLFLQDVINEVFGPEYAERCVRSEQDSADENYLEAWSWATSLSFAGRQRAIRLLAAEARTREHWDEDYDQPIPPRDSEEWFESLAKTVE